MFPQSRGCDEQSYRNKDNTEHKFTKPKRNEAPDSDRFGKRVDAEN